MILIAEDLLLLLLDDETGAASAAQQMAPALGGAALVELALLEAVTVERSGRWSAARVRVVEGVAVEDPLLQRALATTAERSRPAQDLVGRLGKGLQAELQDRLVGRGILERRDDKLLGLFPRTRWPARDSSHEDAVRRDLAAVLLGSQQPDARTAALVALLSALGRAHRTIDHGGMSGGEVKRRAKAVAEGDWAARGVSDAIAASSAALVAVVAASGVAAAAGG